MAHCTACILGCIWRPRCTRRRENPSFRWGAAAPGPRTRRRRCSRGAPQRAAAAAPTGPQCSSPATAAAAPSPPASRCSNSCARRSFAVNICSSDRSPAQQLCHSRSRAFATCKLMQQQLCLTLFCRQHMQLRQVPGAAALPQPQQRFRHLQGRAQQQFLLQALRSGKVCSSSATAAAAPWGSNSSSHYPRRLTKTRGPARRRNCFRCCRCGSPQQQLASWLRGSDTPSRSGTATRMSCRSRCKAD